jgi:membrane associated rhomboid family serine protease
VAVKQIVRDAPATSFLLALWVAVFVAMAAYQGGLHLGGNIVTDGILPPVGDLFGSQTTRQLYAGQLWRSLSATWIHYSLIHILGNMWVLYQVGPLVESWYGSGTFLLLYAAIGWLGNLIPGLLKPWIALALDTPVADPASGGGSGFVCGLIALLAVVGWRSRTRFGDYIRGQMVTLLVYIAIVGVVLPNVDNYGHAGGALVGALVGLFHRTLLRVGPGRLSRALGVLALAILAGCGAAQYRQARAEIRLVAAERHLAEDVDRLARTLNRLVMIEMLYRDLARRGAAIGPAYDLSGGRFVGADRSKVAARLRSLADALDREPAGLDGGPTEAAYRDVLALAGRAGDRLPTPGEIVLFRKQMERLKARASREFVVGRNELQRSQQARSRR